MGHDDEDLICVKSFNVKVSIPTTREGPDGEREMIDDDVLAKTAENFAKELGEIGFSGTVRSVAQSIAEEQFGGFRPIIETDEE